MGVWIETDSPKFDLAKIYKSHPVWVCGLKLYAITALAAQLGHTLYGCVD